jgi:hypothetical protein
MKSRCLTLLALLFVTGLFSQEPVITKGVIKQVTVYRTGAYAKAEAPVKVTKGPNIIELRGLPFSTNTESIQVGGTGVFTINSITNSVYYRDTDTLEKQSKAYIIGLKKDSLSAIMGNLTDDNAVLQNELQLLIKNQIIGSSVSGLKLIDLKSAMAYYAPRFAEIKLAILNNTEKYNDMLMQFSICQRELNELTRLGEKEVSVIIDLTAENNETINLTVDFLMTNCGWSPVYDARTDGVTEKLNITYKADVWQKTGIDWNNVDFALSTGSPTQNNNYSKANRRYYTLAETYITKYEEKPKRKTTPTSSPKTIGTHRTLANYVNSITGIVTDGKEPMPYVNVALVDIYGNLTGGVQTDLEGKFKLAITPESQYIKASYVGFSTVTYFLINEFIQIELESSGDLEEIVIQYSRPIFNKGEVAEKPQYSTFNNITTTEFKINTPYTILSDGKENQVEINNTEFKALYEYYAVPELNQSVFLTAKMMEFENAGYENGPLNVFINDAFVAATSLVLPQTNDTAIVSLGYDKGIVITRERVKNKSKVSLLGGKKVENFAFTTSIRNTKNAPVKIQVQEQIPIARDNKVTVSDIKYENATYDENTGILTWWVTIKAKEKMVLDYEYVITYPAKSAIVIH